MFWRIEELEDLLIEMKQKSGVSWIVELEGQINHLNLEIARKGMMIEELNEWIKDISKKETMCLDESEAINFFSELLKEKESIIKKLSSQVGTLTNLEQEKESERQKLTQLIEKRNEEFDDLKSKWVRFTEMMKDRDLRTGVQDGRSKWFGDDESIMFK